MSTFRLCCVAFPILLPGILCARLSRLCYLITFNAYLFPVFFSTHSTTLPLIPTPRTVVVMVYTSVIGDFFVSNGVLVPNKEFIFDDKTPSLSSQNTRQLKTTQIIVSYRKRAMSFKETCIYLVELYNNNIFRGTAIPDL